MPLMVGTREGPGEPSELTFKRRFRRVIHKLKLENRGPPVPFVLPSSGESCPSEL